MSFLSRLLEPVRVNPYQYQKGLFARIRIVLIELFGIYTMQRIAFFVQQENTYALKQWIIIFSGVLIVGYIIKRIQRHERRPNSYVVTEKYLYKKYFQKIISIQPNYIEKIGTGGLTEIVGKGIDTRKKTLETLQSWLPELLLKPLFAVWIISQISYIYALIFIGCLVSLCFISNYFNNQATKERHPRKNIEIAIQKRFIRIFMSRLEILQSSTIDHEIFLQHSNIDNAAIITKRMADNLIMMYSIPIVTMQLMIIFLIIYCIQAIQNGNFSFSIYTGIVTTVGFMANLSIEINAKYKGISQDIVHLEKLREQIDNAPLMENYDTGKPFIYKNGTIDIKNMSFAYNDGLQVFDNFSVSLQGGKKTAFVGNSGSGKSTLVKLISGLLSPDKGMVSIDGQDLSKVSLKSFYQHIGFLQQEPIIFDGTVRENILYGLRPTPSPSKAIGTSVPLEGRGSGGGQDEQYLSSIIQKSQCQFIYDLPQGLDTEVGERGIRLSGGQKQRLAIARIFAKNPDIIILDEPTSALDSFAEEEITKALHELCKGKSVLIIAHRLQTVKEADDIIVLGTSGKDLVKSSTIIERGTHSDLIAQRGHYAKMLELQAAF